MKALIFLCVVTGAALVYLMSEATSNTALFARNYPLLLGLGGGLALGLMALIVYQLLLLRRKLRDRVFGSKLTLRLMAVFTLMALIPGGLVYAISFQFLQRSIESWFDVKVDESLKGGINLARSALENSLKDLSQKADAMAHSLATSQAVEATTLNRLREQHSVEEATLMTPRGRVIAQSGIEPVALLPDLPNANVLRQVRAQQKVTSIEAIPDRGLYLRVIVPVNVLTIADDIRILQVLQHVPQAIAQDAEIVEAGYKDYQELQFARVGLKRIFGLTLTLALLLTLFSSIALAFVLSERLSAPLSALAEATRAIAKGDYSKLNPVKSRDEFGVLTQSFNTMTRQIADASEAMERNQQQLENAKTYLESILSNLSSGVLTFDERMYVKTMNAAGNEILAVPPGAFHGLKLSDWPRHVQAVAPFAEIALRHFASSGTGQWEEQMEYRRADGPRTLLLRGTRLGTRGEPGYVVVFDDITHLLQAQRDAAWGEVARRLAHEIKNPLTPIQLSAERLQQKLHDKLPTTEADILRRATGTIVSHVSAMKGMVDDFTQYAHASRMNARPIALNDLVREVLVLYEAMGVAIEARLAEGLPQIHADPGMLRQVLHNLFQNAIDALAGIESPRILVATSLGSAGVLLTVRDNGSGIAEGVMGRIFEPYVTTKPKGTGLGLAIVKKIVDEHHGRILVENVKPHGATVSIVLPSRAAA
ncbi:MAG TPA: ATP-binding protein [Usitatibacter sp.]|jgi:nitrogen fixation/metabolism regulation signal transduction histidine kinase|nr:ATP-binding protein [Usitatibacter sp.]